MAVLLFVSMQTKKAEDENLTVKDVLSVIDSLKKQVAAKRVVSVKV